jgi:hypothetical protein
MTQWFVPPIVIPAAMVAYFVALVLYRHFVGAWNQSEPDPEELLALVALQEGDPNRMSIRTTRKIVKFSNPFTMEGVGRVLPAGNYEVVTDEELIEGLSFPVYRRVATMMLAPTQTSHSIEMLTIDPRDLAAAVERDTLAVKGEGGDGNTLACRRTRQTSAQAWAEVRLAASNLILASIRLLAP